MLLPAALDTMRSLLLPTVAALLLVAVVPAPARADTICYSINPPEVHQSSYGCGDGQEALVFWFGPAGAGVVVFACAKSVYVSTPHLQVGFVVTVCTPIAS